MGSGLLRWAFALAVLAASAAPQCGCASDEPVVRNALVAYRDRQAKGGAPRGASMLLANRGNPEFAGDKAASITGLKIVSDENMAWFLGRIGENGFFDDAEEARDIGSILASRPASQLLVVEVEGKTRVLAGEAPRPGDAAAAEKARKFSEMKMRLIELCQDQTSFQVVPNREGGDYFARQQEELGKRGKADGGGR